MRRNLLLLTPLFEETKRARFHIETGYEDVWKDHDLLTEYLLHTVHRITQLVVQRDLVTGCRCDELAAVPLCATTGGKSSVGLARWMRASMLTRKLTALPRTSLVDLDSRDAAMLARWLRTMPYSVCGIHRLQSDYMVGRR
jgi:hypothetical protein